MFEIFLQGDGFGLVGVQGSLRAGWKDGQSDGGEIEAGDIAECAGELIFECLDTSYLADDLFATTVGNLDAGDETMGGGGTSLSPRGAD